MVSRKLVQRTNAWLIRVEFVYTYSLVNGLCFCYFKMFPERSPFDLKITLTPSPYVSRLSDHTVHTCLSEIQGASKCCMYDKELFHANDRNMKITNSADFY